MKKLEWCLIGFEFLVFIAIALGIWLAVYELHEIRTTVNSLRGEVPMSGLGN